MLQRHMSAVMLFGIIGVSMMFASDMPAKYFWRFIGLCLIAGVILLLVLVVKGGGNFSYISERIESWKDPLSDPSDTTHQTYESLLAIGSGGWFGLGFGESRQKYLYLPESQNDFIFAIICEELGFVGGAIVVLLFVVFILKGFQIAANSRDRFGMLLATGITVQIGSQALLNIMVATNAFPNTGISLPFFSAGGTALVFQLFEMGILLSISRQNVKRKKSESTAQRNIATE
jgi:cell division protein FtsW